MKTYVLMISEKFPATHPKAGFATNFPLAIKHYDKIHTIRGNYKLWKERFEKIDAGEAILSVRIWDGKPYRSKQLEIFRYDNTKGIGVEKAIFSGLNIATIGDKTIFRSQLAQNDGLSREDFDSWFSGYDLTKPMAVIHFTPFRYAK